MNEKMRERNSKKRKRRPHQALRHCIKLVLFYFLLFLVVSLSEMNITLATNITNLRQIINP